MSTHTVPTPIPEPSQPPRVEPCNPSLENDLGSIIIMCDCRRDRRNWHITHPEGVLTEPEVIAAFAAHRAECEARG